MISTGAALVCSGSGRPLVVNGVATTVLVVSPGCVLAAAVKLTTSEVVPPTASCPTFVQKKVPAPLPSTGGTALPNKR